MPQSSTVPPVFAGLQPAAVWAHFATLCRIPRASKHEAALRAELLAWAHERGLAAEVDAAGNLLVRKPATAGREHAPDVVLQAHLDMVCQKNSDSAHDFLRDPIVPVLEDGWLLAEKTTLGADNGIGVALILAVLDSRDIAHGPIDALLTVDEEAGMGGARGLAQGVLRGRLMLNLDTEEWGEFYLGCAGGLDVNVERPGRPDAMPDGYQGWQIALNGLRGGHSGVDIHEGRGNAIKLLVRVLRRLESDFPLRLAELRGGTARNALPREAAASFALPRGMGDSLAVAVAELQAQLRSELQGIEDELVLAVSPCMPDSLLMPDEQALWLASLHAAPHGVRSMSRQVPGVVETSNNLGMVNLGPAGGSCNFMVRSLRDSCSLALADEIASLWALGGTAAVKDGYYPGWAPNPVSALLKVCQAVYKRDFAADSSVQVIHAGLECGIIGAKYPGLDIVSFGPTIRGAHAPGERVEVASVARCWQLLTAILAELR
ncbi:aminoacyl-histidine dipeptidase [Dechloromonas sp. CZR5]|uniref:aminoacyl-histidine dipeptidase n=1 Tax=Dechloromonas sp. CZR5 TaxID=2608630 RepID=UPI00123D885D|nr:aminoacyl-histidine dipeptidase [Dechloromonas sp. CZR5]